jgi:hypothetical protein
LPALRLALDAHPLTRGAEATHRLHEGPGMLTAEVSRAGQWSTRKTIRLGTAEHVHDDVETLAIYARETHRNHLRNLAETPKCPVCEAIAGWAPACEKCRPGPSGVPDDVLRADQPSGFASPRPTEQTPLPTGWKWDPVFHVTADGPRLPPGADTTYAYAGLEPDGSVFTHDDEPALPDVLDALRTEAQRIGHPWIEPIRPETMGPDDPRRLVDAAPQGYTFGKVTGPSGERGVYSMTVKVQGGCATWHYYSDTVDVNDQHWAAQHPKAHAYVRAMLQAAVAEGRWLGIVPDAPKPWQPKGGDTVIALPMAAHPNAYAGQHAHVLANTGASLILRFNDGAQFGWAIGSVQNAR